MPTISIKDIENAINEFTGETCDINSLLEGGISCSEY